MGSTAHAAPRVPRAHSARCGRSNRRVCISSVQPAQLRPPDGHVSAGPAEPSLSKAGDPCHLPGQDQGPATVS